MTRTVFRTYDDWKLANPDDEWTHDDEPPLVIAVHVRPPIPDRRWDWCAYRDGQEELGHYGWGATEAEAVADLKDLDDAERDEPPIFNPALHDHLTGLGYAFTFHEADWEDTGDAESGPELSGGPAWNEYLGPDEAICVDTKGHVVHRMARDLEFERWWCDEHGSQP